MVTHTLAIDSTVLTVLFSCGSSHESSVPEMDILTELEAKLAPLNKVREKKKLQTLMTPQSEAENQKVVR